LTGIGLETAELHDVFQARRDCVNAFRDTHSNVIVIRHARHGCPSFIHRKLNMRVQVRMRAGSIASFRQWLRSGYADLDADAGGLGEPKQARVVFHALRCDATNASVWQKSKLHITEAMFIRYVRISHVFTFQRQLQRQRFH
jgi:hypothetical protein